MSSRSIAVILQAAHILTHLAFSKYPTVLKKVIAGEIPSIAPGPFHCQSKPISAVYLTPPSIFGTYLTDAKSP